MVITGSRQSGKTYWAIEQILREYKIGQTIGVLGYRLESSQRIRNEIIARAKSKTGLDISSCVKLISFENRDRVDRYIIDGLDLLLGRNCISTVNDVVEVYRKDDLYTKCKQERPDAFATPLHKVENIINHPIKKEDKKYMYSYELKLGDKLGIYSFESKEPIYIGSTVEGKFVENIILKEDTIWLELSECESIKELAYKLFDKIFNETFKEQPKITKPKTDKDIEELADKLLEGMIEKLKVDKGIDITKNY